jgi:hypothetical protein
MFSHHSRRGVDHVEVAIAVLGHDVVGRQLVGKGGDVVDEFGFAGALGLALDLRDRFVDLESIIMYLDDFFRRFSTIFCEKLAPFLVNQMF